jgi:hypothetical protein
VKFHDRASQCPQTDDDGRENESENVSDENIVSHGRFIFKPGRYRNRRHRSRSPRTLVPLRATAPHRPHTIDGRLIPRSPLRRRPYVPTGGDDTVRICFGSPFFNHPPPVQCAYCDNGTRFVSRVFPIVASCSTRSRNSN